MATKTTPNEEIDLGKLFQIIGNGFRKFFNAIGNFLKAIFHYLILCVLFFRKYALYLIIGGVLGAIVGYIYQNMGEKKASYASEMSVFANFGSAKRLYEQVDYLNNLLEEEDSLKVASIFNITPNEANGLKKFAVEPIDSEKQLLNNFDKYIKTTDTIYTKDFTFEDFEKRYTDTDLESHTITVMAKNPEVSVKLKNGIKDLVENDYYKNIHKSVQEEINFKEKEIRNSLKKLDSIRKRYDEVAILQAKNNSAKEGSINFSNRGESEKNDDVELFNLSNTYVYRLELLNKDKMKNEQILHIISDFDYGEEVSGIKTKLWFKYAIYGAILAFLIIIGLKFNTYLNNYEKKLA